MHLRPGYLGICKVNGTNIRVTGFSVNLQQDVQFYDHIIGLRDSVPSGLGAKGDTGELNVQKYAWRPGVKIVSGNFSFPATNDGLKEIFDLAKTGDDFSMSFSYSCQDVERKFVDCKINSFTFSVVAGDFVQVSVDIMGRKVTEGFGSGSYKITEKITTWDKVDVTSTSGDTVQALNFTVNNNCIPIYTAGNNFSDDLLPKEIRVGMQHVTGTIVYYKKGIGLVGLDSGTGSDDIDISIGGGCGAGSFGETLTVIYKPIERASNIGALLHTLPFVGVGNALGN